MTIAPLLLDLDRGCRCAPEDLRRVHLFSACRRRPERSGGCGADDVAELVEAFAQPGGEELHTVVVPLDVIEAAVAPPALPVTLVDGLPHVRAGADLSILL